MLPWIGHSFWKIQFYSHNVPENIDSIARKTNAFEKQMRFNLEYIAKEQRAGKDQKIIMAEKFHSYDFVAWVIMTLIVFKLIRIIKLRQSHNNSNNKLKIKKKGTKPIDIKW